MSFQGGWMTRAQRRHRQELDLFLVPECAASDLVISFSRSVSERPLVGSFCRLTGTVQDAWGAAAVYIVMYCENSMLHRCLAAVLGTACDDICGLRCVILMHTFWFVHDLSISGILCCLITYAGSCTCASGTFPSCSRVEETKIWCLGFHGRCRCVVCSDGVGPLPWCYGFLGKA